MISIVDAIRVGRLTGRRKAAASARTTPLLRVVLVLFCLLAFSLPLAAQEQGGGEADLNLPNLNTATFLGNIPGGTLLMGGLVVSALGLIFGLMIYFKL